MSKYAILYKKEIVEYFDDPVEAIRKNRLKQPVNSKVIRIEEDNTFTLLAQNKRISNLKNE